MTTEPPEMLDALGEDLKATGVAPEYHHVYGDGFIRGWDLALSYLLDPADEPENVEPPAPLSGEWAGESIPEVFGLEPHDPWPGEDVLDAYEAGYYRGFTASLERGLDR